MGIIMQYIKLFLYRKNWRKRNSHNETYLKEMANNQLIEVGRGTYGLIDVQMFSDKYKLRIGNYCSIGPNVMFVLSSEHPLNHISTFPFKVKCLHQEYEATSKGDIVIDDDVWIGCNVTIMSGVHIGQGAVIAAGAIVTKNVPPYAIVAGNPARVIRYRFAEDIIEELMKIDYGKIDKKFVEDHLDDFYEEITSVEQVQRIIGENK